MEERHCCNSLPSPSMHDERQCALGLEHSRYRGIFEFLHYQLFLSISNFIFILSYTSLPPSFFIYSFLSLFFYLFITCYLNAPSTYFHMPRLQTVVSDLLLNLQMDQIAFPSLQRAAIVGKTDLTLRLHINSSQQQE